MYKAGGVSITERLTMLFTSRWESGEVPQDLRDAVIVSLYKKKGEKKCTTSLINLSAQTARASLSSSTNLGKRIELPELPYLSILVKEETSINGSTG